MKKQGKKSAGLGSFVYTEWFIPIVDYYRSLRKNEMVFEVMIPSIISAFCTLKYWKVGKLFMALDGIAEVMPTAISVLIGFTVMLITLLLTSSGPNIEILKETETGRILHKENITLYQGLHIQFSHSLFSEVFLLLLIFFYKFLSGLVVPAWTGVVILAIEIYLTLNVLFSILRGVTNLYFSFFKQKQT